MNDTTIDVDSLIDDEPTPTTGKDDRPVVPEGLDQSSDNEGTDAWVDGLLDQVTPSSADSVRKDLQPDSPGTVPDSPAEYGEDSDEVDDKGKEGGDDAVEDPEGSDARASLAALRDIVLPELRAHLSRTDAWVGETLEAIDQALGHEERGNG